MNCDMWLQLGGSSGPWLNLSYPPLVEPCGRGYRVRHIDGLVELVDAAHGRRLLVAIGSNRRHIPLRSEAR